jgi:hypothetical protein
MSRKKRWVARFAFEVQFDAVSPNKAVEQGEKIADQLKRIRFTDDIAVTASTGAMIAPVAPEGKT